MHIRIVEAFLAILLVTMGISIGCGKTSNNASLSILDHKCSNVFEAYYRSIESILGKSVRYVSVHDTPATNNDSSDEVIVYIPDTIPDSAIETVAAHELTHVVLSREGFPAVGCRACDTLPPDVAAALERIGNGLMGMVLDPLISQRLEAEGFPVKKVNSDFLQEQTDELETWQSPPSPEWYKSSWWNETLPLALFYTHAQMDVVSDGTSDRFLSAVTEHAPAAADLGVILLAKVEETGYETPEQCVQCLKNVGDYLQLYPLLVHDMTTDTNYFFPKPPST